MKRKKILQFVHLSCGRVHINSCLEKLGVSYKLQHCLLKQDLENGEFYEDTWEARENEWLPYVEEDVLLTAFCYAR